MAAKTDAVLIQNPEPGEVLFDFQIGPDGDILTEDQLETAIIVSLFTDKRATPEQVSKPHLRRGWVGDLETPLDPWGSRLWLLEQARLDREAESIAVDAAKEALGWMVRDEIAISAGARAFRTETKLDLRIDLTKPNSRSETTLVSLWDNTGG